MQTPFSLQTADMPDCQLVWFLFLAPEAVLQHDQVVFRLNVYRFPVRSVHSNVLLGVQKVGRS